jgi:hypothetical protein
MVKTRSVSKTYSRLLAAGLMIFALMPALVVAQPPAPWVRARRLISRTQNDVQQAASFAAGGSKSDREHYDAALKHLSDFDRDLTRSRFNKGRLDDSIGDVQRILDHNTLNARGRNLLQRDVVALRRLRADYDSWHD